MNGARVGAFLAAVCLVLGGCSRRPSTKPEGESGGPAGRASPPRPESATARSPSSSGDDVSLDLLEPSPRCRIEHRGAVVDLGSPEAAWSTPGHPDAGSDVPGFERDGTTWGRVLDRTQTFAFALDAAGPAVISVRGRARGGKKAIASVDGKTVGQLVLTPGEDRVASATSSGAGTVLSPGLHTVTLRWIGPVKKDEPVAELDWIRLGVVDDDPSAYAAPIRRDAVGQVAIGGAPRRAFILRAPSLVRCVAWVPPGAQLVADAGAVGEGGEGVVEIRERETGGDTARVVSTERVGVKAWSGIRTPLGVGGASGAIGIVEIAVTRAPKQGRVAIAEPRIVRAKSGADRPSAGPNLEGHEGRDGAHSTAPAPPPPVTAVIVVMAGATTSVLELPSLQKLAREGVTFRNHRAPSALAAASLASLVTGLPVPVHAVEDSGARLSPRTPLLGRLLAPFGVDTAMFTEAPTSGPAFGFAHDWAHYAARSPLDGPPVAYEEVAKFVSADVGKKIAIIAHARGAHPPWDVPPEALKSLAPEGYSGPVEPKHVVALLGKVRRNLLHFNDADRARIAAIADIGLRSEDRRLDALVEELRAKGVLDNALLVVTSDAPYRLPTAPAPRTEPAAGSASALHAAPPPPAATAGEEPLAIPLVIRFPRGFAAGRVVTAATDPTDVAATIVSAYRGPITELAGRDLATLAADDAQARNDPRLIDDGRGYQLAWGDLRLVGAWGRTPSLRVRLTGEELRARRPYEYLAAWGLAAEARDRWLAARAKGPGREPATIDAATAAAMDAWERGR